MSDAGSTQVLPDDHDGAEWRRLSWRVIWLDLVVAALSTLPGLIAFTSAPTSGAFWALMILASIGLIRSGGDALRWTTTRYRVTDSEVQRRSGVFIRRSRFVRRDRLRSVDTFARFRHRVAGMRVVTIGAGQQTGAGEAALELDALARDDAERLKKELLGSESALGSEAALNHRGAADEVVTPDAEPEAHSAEADASEEQAEVLETFRFRWVFYNVFTIWSLLMAAVVVWTGGWALTMFGVDVWGWARETLFDSQLGTLTMILLVLGVGMVLGSLFLGVSFILENWGFQLSRVQSEGAPQLRTRRGLLTTREVNRDETRVRGISIDEPLWFRWMGLADTQVLTTGLRLDSFSEATALVPRGPISVARRVASQVVGDAFDSTNKLAPHPRAALWRRLSQATLLTLGVALILLLPALNGLVPFWVMWIPLGLWPVALLGAVIAYRALGHVIHGKYVVTRSGLASRSTAVLRRDAISTVAVSQSILQRWLGLSTVSFMTAAGWGEYDVEDVDATTAFTFADMAAPGIMSPFLEQREDASSLNH